MKPKFYYSQLLKTVKHLLNKHIGKQKKHWNLNVPNQEKHSFKPQISIQGSWIIGQTSSEVYSSFFIVPEEKPKFELYKHTFEKFSSEELKDELEEILSFSDVTPYHLQHEKFGPRINEAYKKLRLEKSSTDGCITLILGNVRPPFRDFEIILQV